MYSFINYIRKKVLLSRVTDQHHLNSDSDPDPVLTSLMRTRIKIFTLMRIRILLLIKVMRIYHHCSKDAPGLYVEPSGLHFEPPVLHFEPLRLQYERPQGPPWLHFEPLSIQLLYFDSGSAAPQKIMRIHADANTQPCCSVKETSSFII
jgi:hypothetical protein